jgi:hypothetical protein
VIPAMHLPRYYSAARTARNRPRAAGSAARS